MTTDSRGTAYDRYLRSTNQSSMIIGSNAESMKNWQDRKQIDIRHAAVNVTLLAFAGERRRACSNRSISPGHRAQRSKPAAAAFGGRMMGQTDGQTDARQFHRPCSAYYASNVSKSRASL